MTELIFLVVLLAGGMAVVAVANSLVRVIIGAEVAIMAGIWGAALSGDLSLVAVATVVGVAETVLMVASLYRLAKEGYV
ncbi:MAG: ferredoxin:quinone oxidoreductase [Pyrobaculum sp.]|nr:ferredoxin:quinone oxidoreductase [Pyrobaculum sp.]